MSAEVIQIRDFQRPEERIACDKRLGYGIPTVYLNSHDELAQAVADLTQTIDIPPDYTPPRSRA